MNKTVQRLLAATGTTALLFGLALVPASAQPALGDHPAQDRVNMTATDQRSNPSPAKTGDQVYGPSNPHYKMDVVYDSQTHQIKGEMSVDFTNNLGFTMNEIYFNLWPNADVFQEKGGGVAVQNIKVNGKPAEHQVDGTALHINGVSLKPGKKASVSMAFTVNIPEGKDRFGWSGSTVSLGNWFPILAVWDREGWNVDPYYPYGEAFYSLTGDYDHRHH